MGEHTPAPQPERGIYGFVLLLISIFFGIFTATWGNLSRFPTLASGNRLLSVKILGSSHSLSIRCIHPILPACRHWSQSNSVQCHLQRRTSCQQRFWRKMSTSRDPGKSSMDTIEFLKIIGRLKHLPRTGWVRNGIKNPETVASHMYRMAIVAAFLLDPDTLDRDKCIRMALVHDMAEALVGDITPSCGVSDGDKFEREKKALEHMASLVSETIGQELLALWREYEAGTTKEAKAVKQLDKFDMVCQAAEYEKSQTGVGNLQEFFDSTENCFKTEPFLSWIEQIKSDRTSISMP